MLSVRGPELHFDGCLHTAAECEFGVAGAGSDAGDGFLLGVLLLPIFAR
jgi:hypothetical protein